MKNKYIFDLNCLSKIRTSERKKFLNDFKVSNHLNVVHKQLKINKKKINYSKIHAISLFSGAGGLDLSSVLSGVKVLSSLDFDQDSIRTIKQNAIFKDGDHFCTDIRDFELKKYNHILKKNKTEKLILIGGPPCQPFSKAGYWVTHKNILGKKDPRNMISEFLNAIKVIQPDGFIIENVESILHPKNLIVVKEIEEFIYKNNFDLIRHSANAIDYGVPQKRKRVFFIATKKKIKFEPVCTHGKNLKPYERVLDWIYNYDDNKFFEKEESVKNKTYEMELKQIPPGKNYFELTERDNHPNPVFKANKRFWNFLLKLNPFLPSWTIPAQPGPWVGPLHWNNRRLRVPEIAAIQTFPSDYIFYGNRRSIQKQIGNAVPPLFGKAMIDCLVKNL